MDNSLPEQTLKKIIDQFGEEIFLDKNRSIGLISDYFARQNKTKKLYINAIRENLPQKLLEIKHLNEVEMEQSVRKIKYYFKDDNGYDEQCANFIINSFIYALEIKTQILRADSQVYKKADRKQININNCTERNPETPPIETPSMQREKINDKIIFGLTILSVIILSKIELSIPLNRNTSIFYGVFISILCIIYPFLVTLTTDTLLTTRFKFGLFLMQIFVPLLGYLGFYLYASKQISGGEGFLIIYVCGIFIWCIGKKLLK